MSTKPKITKVSDEHTFLVCGGMIEEEQFVSLLQGIQRDLVEKNPGQGFENLKWRYKMDFSGDTFNEVKDVYDYLLQDLSNLSGKNSKKDFLRDIESLMTKFSNKTSEEYVYLNKLWQDVSKTPYQKFDIKFLEQKIQKKKRQAEHKSIESGNIGYLWVSDPRVFEYLSSELSGVQTLGDYLNYLYINNRDTYNELNEIYHEMLQSYTQEEALEYLQKIYEEEYVNRFSTTSKIFVYEYNFNQRQRYGQIFTQSKPWQCGKYLTLNNHQGYVEFNKAKIALTDRINKEYLIAKNPGNITHEELMDKIGIFDVNIIQSDSEIILTEKTPGKHGLVFFDAVYINGIRVMDENGNIHILRFEFR